MTRIKLSETQVKHLLFNLSDDAVENTETGEYQMRLDDGRILEIDTPMMQIDLIKDAVMHHPTTDKSRVIEFVYDEHWYKMHFALPAEFHLVR